MKFDQADALNEAIRAVGIRHRALAVAALAPMGIHPGHKLLLLELAAGPRTQAQLAAASGYEPPSITESGRQLAEQTIAGLRSTTVDHLTDVLTDLAASLTSTVAPTNDIPRYRVRRRRRR